MKLDVIKTVLVGAVTLALVSPAPAAAQIWIGQIAAEMVGAHIESKLEAACLAGAPPNPKAAQEVLDAADQLMGAYFELTSRSTRADAAEVFAMKLDGAGFRDGAGYLRSEVVGPWLDEPAPTLAQRSAVVAGDLQSARVIWTATPPGGMPKVLAADFLRTPDGLFLKWRIWRLAEAPLHRAPSAPPPYCHFDPAQGF